MAGAPPPPYPGGPYPPPGGMNPPPNAPPPGDPAYPPNEKMYPPPGPGYQAGPFAPPPGAPMQPGYGQPPGYTPPTGPMPPPGGYAPPPGPPPGQPGYMPPPAQPGYMPPPGYGPPPGQPPMQGGTVVIGQPTTTVVQVGAFREMAASAVCPHCHAQVVTSTEYESGTFTYLVCAAICLLGCDFGCCLIPFCVDGCKDVVHHCPNCKQQISRWSRL